MPKQFIAVQYLKEGNYWREKFAEPITKSGFPYDENVSGVYSKDKVQFAFSDEVSAKLIKMSGGSLQRLQMILVAGMACLLYKYTGNEDILIGSPIYAQEASCEFINTVLALRNKIVGSYSFKDCILQVKQTVIEAIENQNYPIEKILELIGGEYDKQGLPLLDTVVMLENIQDRKHSKNVRANLLFAFVKVEGELKCTAEYNNMHFQRRIVERILIHLNKLFIAIVRDINVRIGDIDILTIEEKWRMIFEFNTSMKDVEVGLLHELFEKQAKKTPENIAVIAENGKMTYREMNQKANQLAKMLRDNGVMPNDIVGIMVENPGAMALGLLGILKSGGAYLPIDSEYPVERIQYLLEDSKIKMLLIYDEIKEGISFNGKTININDKDRYLGEVENLERVNKPEDLAYIIYTSGTTGKPKGVMIEHKSITKTIKWRSEEYRLNQNDTAMQLFSYAFDGFVTSFFTPLVSGTKLIMLSNKEHKDLNVIKKCICENKVTHFICVPSLYRAIMEYLTPVEAKSLRIVTLAGEKLTANVVKWSKRINPDLELVNEYGPTENSVVSTICRDINLEGITIGRPVVNTRVYIMDSDGNMVPEGVAGELCLSSNRLARGYLNRPELNNEKFIMSRLGKGERIYKTGDIARWLPDGNIEYLGRKDSQVKIRGFRIELREIETKLLAHEHIQDAAVIDQKDIGGDSYLCAYIVSEEELTAANLREYLLGKLPDYMVPSFFVKLDKIPLTYNGKIDRKALSQLGSKMKLGTLYVAPRNVIEEKLVEVWREVLEVERIGIDDNFFDLGGNSLKAIQAVAQLSLEFKIKINDVFVYKNIRNLAAGISFKSSNLKNTIE